MDVKYYYNKKEVEFMLGIAESKFPGISEVVNKRYALISVGNKKELFFFDKPLKKIYEQLEHFRHPYSLGLFFGTFEGESFTPSLQIIQKYSKKFKRKFVVIEPGFEQKFLHGRNVQKRRIISFDKTLRKGDLAIVTTTLHEALGLGIILKPLDEFEKADDKDTFVKNALHLGKYLHKSK